MLFEFVAYLTGLTILVFILLAWVRHRDPFHPTIYIGPMLFFLYSFLPLYLTLTQGEVLRAFLRDDELLYVQVLNAVGVFSLCAGILVGSGRAGAWYRLPAQGQVLSPAVGRRLAGAALVLGTLGVASYLYQVMNVGGFAEAYGRGYGGGWADVGYARDAMLFTVPALLLLLTARHANRYLWLFGWLCVLLFVSPMVLQGLLGGRRGPIFMIAVALWAGWYFARFRRPRIATCALIGPLIGLLMLSLIANRSDLYLGSDFSLDRGVDAYVFHVGEGNEFVFGAGAILHSDIRGEYWWGRRYAIMLFVRPIPGVLWPSKYEDASAALHAPDLRHNMGIGGDIFSDTLGWTEALGAAPGIVADMWVEFWLTCFPVLFVVGWCYGRTWSQAVRRGGVWGTIYCLMFSLSVYLVMQTLEAMLYRFLLLASVTCIAWWYAQGSYGTARTYYRPSGGPNSQACATDRGLDRSRVF